MDLITASILSKKLAAGLQGLVMDVKFGSGAFMENFDDARALAESIVTVATGADVPTTALLTDMNEVLGDTVGNAVEVREAVRFLTGVDRESRLAEVTLACTGELLVLAGGAKDMGGAKRMMETALASGAAAERFGRMIAGLGGPTDFLERTDAYLDIARTERPVSPDRAGFVTAMDSRAVGMVLVAMGGGRTRADQVIDHAVGMTGFAHIGDAVGPDTPLCTVRARDGIQADMAAERIRAAVTVGDAPPPPRPVIRERITAETVKEDN
jgi:thymidine phosphorylase